MRNDNSIGLAVEVRNKVNLLFKEINTNRRDCQYFYAANSVVPLYLIDKIATQEKKSTLLIHQTYLGVLRNKNAREMGRTFIPLNDSATKNISSVLKSIKNKHQAHHISFVLLPDSALLLKTLIAHAEECKDLMLFIDFDYSSLKRKSEPQYYQRMLKEAGWQTCFINTNDTEQIIRTIEQQIIYHQLKTKATVVLVKTGIVQLI